MARPRALIAEDDASLRGLLSMLLESDGWVVDAVGDGRQAIRLATSVQPDLVVTDLAMPSLGGIGLARALRDDPALHEVPLLAVTAGGSRLYREAVRSRLFRAVLRKPIVPRRFLGTVRRTCGS